MKHACTKYLTSQIRIEADLRKFVIGKKKGERGKETRKTTDVKCNEACRHVTSDGYVLFEDTVKVLFACWRADKFADEFRV